MKSICFSFNFPLLSLVLSLLCTGCLTFRQTIAFQKDSSCVVTYEYSFPEANLPLWESAHAFLKEKQQFSPGNFMEEKSVREFFTKNGQEVRLYRQYVENQIRHVKIIVLARDGEKAINSGVFGDFKLTRNVLGDHNLTGRLASLPSALPAETLESLKKLVNGISIQLTVSTPTAMIKSNGIAEDYKKVHWNFAWPQVDGTANLFAPDSATLEATW